MAKRAAETKEGYPCFLTPSLLADQSPGAERTTAGHLRRRKKQSVASPQPWNTLQPPLCVLPRLPLPSLLSLSLSPSLFPPLGTWTGYYTFAKSQARGAHALFQGSAWGEKGDLGRLCLSVLHVLCILSFVMISASAEGGMLASRVQERGGPIGGLWCSSVQFCSPRSGPCHTGLGRLWHIMTRTPASAAGQLEELVLAARPRVFKTTRQLQGHHLCRPASVSTQQMERADDTGQNLHPSLISEVPHPHKDTVCDTTTYDVLNLCCGHRLLFTQRGLSATEDMDCTSPVAEHGKFGHRKCQICPKMRQIGRCPRSFFGRTHTDPQAGLGAPFLGCAHVEPPLPLSVRSTQLPPTPTPPLSSLIALCASKHVSRHR
ncbi:unnamed protein product [Pleuronectes platessa]|uniref:Uncharacterized protein n=1 Tax=Pleuronectes platessa TaxID=8262 RepID=A0A9N7VJG7_PLEPL|nr:unnamed protein product [Pleuronectes platessa]